MGNEPVSYKTDQLEGFPNKDISRHFEVVYGSGCSGTVTKLSKHRWVIDSDIKGFFDNIGHEILMLAVKWLTKEKYIFKYVER
jgi:hypothetical protein